MIRVEDISWDAVRLTMVGRLERPEGVTVQEWTDFWSRSNEAQNPDAFRSYQESESRLDEMQGEIEELEAKIGELEEECADLERENEGLKDRVQDLSNEIDDLEERIDGLEDH